MSSTHIYSHFEPTYLYIKQHSVTGLMYFGKTTKSDPIKYLGSGKHWIRHINKHGTNHVVTLWHELFTNRDECVNFALQFSKDLNIVESKSWANLIEEDGLNGWPKGQTHSDETRQKLSNLQTHRKASVETRLAISKSKKGENHPLFGAHHSDETKRKMRESQLANPNIVSCPHCNKTGYNRIMKRWHFDNCKLLSTTLKYSCR